MLAGRDGPGLLVARRCVDLKRTSQFDGCQTAGGDATGGSMRQGTRFRSGSEARLSERLNWLRERHALPAPISITRATFSAVPAAISFTRFTALIFEFASATQSGAIAAGLCLFDQVLLRRRATNAICGHGCRRGGREDESEARSRDGCNYQRSHFVYLLGFFLRPSFNAVL
jgi:hypothetical protein